MKQKQQINYVMTSRY